MAKTPPIDAPLRKNEKVIATEDLPRVPEGTTGVVKLVNGFTWTRYWVFFDNGVQMGSIDGSKLVRAAHWEEYKVRRVEEAERREREGEAAATAAAEAPAETAAVDDGKPK
ncbi:MAG: hypothetical protein S0880_26855, partial [Actinomycetota bacterium]|nr:hypothetical protein [Actinomycetota bacterium]